MRVLNLRVGCAFGVREREEKGGGIFRVSSVTFDTKFIINLELS